ncbi:hypothetical protein E2C01_030417 [Portunus trituberculatus]|uniref:Uncharacterized protein n=1 Tax=Portunus trituberculatus TaxID=210409 RepID=A0A5B7EU71_PORTR|nr:hypothetical protein [Portunus trituberculatus]
MFQSRTNHPVSELTEARGPPWYSGTMRALGSEESLSARRSPFLYTSMFTINFAFPLPSLTLLVNFSILDDIEQLVQHPIRIPESLGIALSILGLFLNFNPSYAVTLSSPLVFSNHNLIFISCTIFSIPPQDFASGDVFSVSVSSQLLRMYNADLPWNDFVYGVYEKMTRSAKEP